MPLRHCTLLRQLMAADVTILAEPLRHITLTAAFFRHTIRDDDAASYYIDATPLLFITLRHYVTTRLRDTDTC